MEAALDTPLVVAATELAPVTTALVAEDGTVVELREQRRLVPPGEFSCVKHSYAFLTAATELASNTRYVFTVRFDKEDNGGLAGAVALEHTTSFMTGTARRDPAPPEVGLSLFGVPLRPQWGERAGTLLDVYVETDAVEPLFVLAEGERDVLVHDLDPLAAERPFRVGFGSIECAALTVVDATGTTLAERVLCDPSKCTLVDSLGDSSCGEESFPPMSWSTWQSLPDGCDREALLRKAEQGPAAAGGAVGVSVPSELPVAMLGGGDVASETAPPPGAEEASRPSQVHAVGGCGLSGGSYRGHFFAAAGLLLSALARRRPSARARG